MTVSAHTHRIEWVAECRCASMGFGHDRQGYKCLECGEWYGDKHPADQHFSQPETRAKE